MKAGRNVISLNGDDWRLLQATEGKPGDTIPATVPGDVRLDLLRAGHLPDPFWGQNSLQGQWVDTRDWWLARDLDDLGLLPDRRVFLRLRGVDYVSNVYFNGRHLARHEGMFSPQLYEITKLMTVGPGKEQLLPGALAVRIAGAANLPYERGGRLTRWRDRGEQRLGAPNRWPHRRAVLKCQMGFGWDFAPDLPSLGLWDDAELIITGDVFIRDVVTRPVFPDGPDGPVRLAVTLDLDAGTHVHVEIGLNLYGLNCDAPPLMELLPVQLDAGRQQLNFELDVPEPHLWWPWDRGDQNLYTLLVTVRRRADLLDNVGQTFGLRHIRLEPNPDAPPESKNGGDVLPWIFVVNGQRTFLRGANWVPPSIFPGQVTADDYEALLDLARQANMNALRVWGGGLREKAAFYDCCDRLGLLVWQEFPLACAFVTRYPHSKEYLALVDQEARAIVRALRRHPSVALWCGGNEFDPARNKPLVETLAAAVAAEDPSRPFVPVSPSGGDRHNWDVWHGMAPVSAYRQQDSQFASEFGLQAPPVKETLLQFMPEKELWPPGPSWAHHNADWPKLWRYAAPFLGRDPDEVRFDQVTLDEFVEASQRAQAHGLQVAIEHHRRRKYACGGSLLWQFNSPWPAIEWAIVDHYRRPKPAYQTVQRLYAPVLVSLEYAPDAYGEGSRYSPLVWVINDRVEPLPGCRLEISLETAGDFCLERAEKTFDVAADSAEVVAEFSWTLPPGTRWVRCRLYQGEEELSFNEYDLGVHDATQPGRLQRLRSRLGERLMGGD